MNQLFRNNHDYDEERPKRNNAPPITVYFIAADDPQSPYKLSCMFCKRTISDGVTGRIDKLVNAPVSATDHDLAINIQCKLCGQIWRILGAPKAIPIAA